MRPHSSHPSTPHSLGTWASAALALALLAAIPANAQTPVDIFVPAFSAGNRSADLRRVLTDSLRRAGFDVLDAATASTSVSPQDLEGWIGCAFGTYACPAPPPGVKLHLVVVARVVGSSIELRSLRPDGHKLGQRYMTIASKWDLENDLEKTVLVWAKDLSVGAGVRYRQPPPYRVFASVGLVVGVVGLSSSGVLTWDASYRWWRLTSRGRAAPESLDVAYDFAQQGGRNQRLAFITGGIGALGLAAGLALGFYLPGKKIELTPARVEVSVGPQGLLVSGVFP